MKKFIYVIILQISLGFKGTGQHIRVRLDFPGNISMVSPNRAPYHGAIWIAPEWRWNGYQYVVVPGYWAKPKKRHHRWNAGYWKNTRRGYCWVPGKWR